MNNKICRYCGTQNNLDYIYCKRCGKLLDAETVAQPTSNAGAKTDFTQPNVNAGAKTDFTQPSGNPPYESNPYTNGNPYNNAPNGNPNGSPYNNAPNGNPVTPEANPQFTHIPTSMEGVNTEDVAIFLGEGAPKYLPIFANLETGRSSGFNLLILLLSALVSPFFASFWFMHKRMNKLGLFIFLVLAAFEFGNLIAIFSLLKDSFATMITTSSVEQMASFIMSEIESNSILSALSSVSQMVSIAVAVLSGIFANKWYKKHVISTIKSITAENEEGYKQALVEKGGTKNALWVTLMIVTIVAIVVLSIIYAATMVTSVI